MPLTYNSDRERFIRMPLSRMSLALEEVERLRRELVPASEDAEGEEHRIEVYLAMARNHLLDAIQDMRTAQSVAAEHFGFKPRETMKT